MILVLGFVLSAILCLVCFVQLLYLESLRLRTREFEALEYFKAELHDLLGYDTEKGAFVFSLIKHTLLVFSGAIFVAAAAASPTAGWIDLLEGFGAGWLVMMGAAYVAPQLLYRRSAGRWAAPLVPLLKFIALLFRPLTLLLGFLQSLFELSRVESDTEKTPAPGEEIEALIEAGEEEGIIEKEDSRLIQSVVAFGDKRVREVMTSRKAMVAFEVSRSLDDLRQLVKNEQYSRIPVFEKTIDHIVGFVHVRDLFELDDEQRSSRRLADLMRKIDGVPESKPVAELLREMQTHGTHIVYVVDEYGNVAGLATMEDLVEEVFGEIRDEHEPPHDVETAADGSITVSGSFDVDHLQEHFGFKPEEGIESTTVGGLVTEWYGAVPKAGAVVRRQGLKIEVLSADELRVDRVRICPWSEPAPEADTE